MISLARRFGAALALCLVSAPALADDVAWVRTSTILRKSPTTQSRALDYLERETRIVIDTCEDRWCVARVHGRRGYVSMSALDFADSRRVIVEETYVAPPPVFYGFGYWGGRSWHRHW